MVDYVSNAEFGCQTLECLDEVRCESGMFWLGLAQPFGATCTGLFLYASAVGRSTCWFTAPMSIELTRGPRSLAGTVSGIRPARGSSAKALVLICQIQPSADRGAEKSSLELHLEGNLSDPSDPTCRSLVQPRWPASEESHRSGGDACSECLPMPPIAREAHVCARPFGPKWCSASSRSRTHR